MSITATVQNGFIRLPAGVDVADGTVVQIELPEAPGSVTDFDAWLKTAAGAATSGLTTEEIMKQTRGEESSGSDWIERSTGGATTGLTTDEILRQTRGEE
jgi:hypothetical protein